MQAPLFSKATVVPPWEDVTEVPAHDEGIQGAR